MKMTKQKKILHGFIPELNKDTMGIVCQYLLKPKFQSWVDEKQIDWRQLSQGHCPAAVDILKQNPKKIYWELLSWVRCFAAVELLKKNPKKIYWNWLSLSHCSAAVDLLKQNPKK